MAKNEEPVPGVRPEDKAKVRDVLSSLVQQATAGAAPAQELLDEIPGLEDLIANYAVRKGLMPDPQGPKT